MDCISKKSEKVILNVIGGNSENVTGSCTTIEYNGKVSLFEFGGIQQGHTVLENYKLNKQLIQEVNPKLIEYIFLAHCHYDHIGNVPALYSNGCNAKIIVPKGSYPLLREMWIDSANIMDRDCAYLSLKSGKIFLPLYTEEEVHIALSNIVEFDSFEIFKLSEDVSFRYFPAGHILLSQQMELFITVNSNVKKIVFTSDLGNIITQDNRVFVEKFHPIYKSNIVIGECTYSERKRSMCNKDLITDKNKIKTVIDQYCVDGGGRVLIPTFSLDKPAVVLWILYELFGKDKSFNIPILLDSPLSIRLLDHYSNILSGDKKEKFKEMLLWKNIKFVITPEDSKSAILDSSPKVILSSGGMLNAGRSVKWATSILPRTNDCILFMGYTGENTLGWKIKNGKEYKTISINGNPIRNKCQIVDLKSFSSHMQRNDLINYYKSFNCEKIYLVHSNMDSKIDFKKDLEAEISKCCKSTKVIAVNKSTSISL